MQVMIKMGIIRWWYSAQIHQKQPLATIERGTDLRQPEVSIAMRYLINQDWITSRESKAEGKGRPVKIYELAKPIHEIMDSIEKEKEKEANNQLSLVKKLRDYIR